MADMSTAELYDALYRDPLTQVLNRRAFLAVGFQAVAIVDMDSLKWLNDTHGHRTGDAYLARLGRELVQEFGDAQVFRISGDEFAVTAPTKARLHAGLERVRSRFHGLSYGVANNLTKADKALMVDKARRETEGTRAGRGLPPPWMDKV
jgi:diguanylate cyclase (GGDEF)-like protein